MPILACGRNQLRSTKARSASGASVSLSIGWTGFTMRPALERRGRSRMRIEAVIVRTLESAPKDATHWSSRGMAKASGLSTSSVQRIWRAFGLQPHRLETFKLSPIAASSPRCAMSSASTSRRPSTPSCCALMRTRKSGPRPQPAHAAHVARPAGGDEHDYKRYGTTSLFAALDIATGQAIGKCFARHRVAEFRKFIDEIKANMPQGLNVHLVMDNYATHKIPLIRNWLAKRPRWHVHLTPTPPGSTRSSASSLSLPSARSGVTSIAASQPPRSRHGCLSCCGCRLNAIAPR